MQYAHLWPATGELWGLLWKERMSWKKVEMLFDKIDKASKQVRSRDLLRWGMPSRYAVRPLVTCYRWVMDVIMVMCKSCYEQMMGGIKILRKGMIIIIDMQCAAGMGPRLEVIRLCFRLGPKIQYQRNYTLYI